MPANLATDEEFGAEPHTGSGAIMPDFPVLDGSRFWGRVITTINIMFFKHDVRRKCLQWVSVDLLPISSLARSDWCCSAYFLTSFLSFAIRSGLVQYSSIPASRHCCRKLSLAFAVTATMGVLRLLTA